MSSSENQLSQLRKGVLTLCVLQTLKTGKSYGLEIARTLREHGLVETEGSIYPLLTRLRDQGLITSDWYESAQGPPRRYYELTPAGRKAMRDALATWNGFQKNVNEFMEGKN